MATRSFYAITPGIIAPQAFKAPPVPLLTHGELWEYSRQAPPSLLFRVRSDKDPGEQLAAGDRLESCVGVVDASTRWRVVFSLTRSMLNSLRHAQLRQGCWQALNFISSQHPASVSIDQRHAMAAELGRVIEGDPENKVPAPHGFEQRIAAGVINILQCENDIEAAHQVPFMSALCPFDEAKDGQRFGERLATVENLTGSVLLGEAFNRLAERAPVWMYASMPELGATKGGDDED